ncbi:MAG: PBP1A family penicillin-binding protein [Sphingobacteriales bacterium]|nr:MAG: PBP1A family penicillin-binding protein [Sphingobacteriales bacterium]
MATPQKKKPAKKQKLHLMKKLWLAFFILLLLPFLIIILINVGAFGKLPDTNQLENPKSPLATEVISADGVVLGKFYKANRSPVDYEDLSPSLINALIATEDARFTEHAGVDIRGLFRVFFKTVVLMNRNSGGGSTISQQLAKNLFPRNERLNKLQLVMRKLQEWVLATELERLYTKEEILAMYLNTVDFGSNAVGIKSAANTFFHKSPSELNEIESAVLIGLLKAPTTFNPVNKPNNSFNRRNTVLAQMNKYGYLEDDKFETLKKQPTKLNYKVESHNEGTATYMREYLRLWVTKWAAEKGLDIYNDGLKIYTTIDSRMQKYAEEATYQHMQAQQKTFFAQFKNSGKKPWTDVPEIIDYTVKRSERYRAMKEDGVDEREITKAFNKPSRMKIFTYKGGEKDTFMSPLDSIKYYKYFLQPGFLAMEPNTGNIKVWVGGVNYKFFKYDHADPKAKRQVGSTFKPFVYAAAINNGFSPCLKVPNTRVVFENYDNWSPQNSDNKYGGMLTLRQGLKESINSITAWVMKNVGIEPVVDLAQKMGIKSKLEPVPSLCLGVADISVYEMVAAYNTFNNKGTYIDPILVSRIEDKNGNIIQEFVPKTVDVLNEQKAYIMVDMMKAVTNGGTGSRLRYKFNLRMPMAGKTGTTQNNSDGWYMGLIPQLTGGVWVGAEDRAVHFTSMNEGQGAAMALPIWGYFLQKVYADKSLNFDEKLDWQRPAGELGVEIDCSKYEETESNTSTEEDVFK